MKPQRPLSRRSFLAAVAGAAVAVPAAAQQPPAPKGTTDRDPGDPPGRGRPFDRDPGDPRPAYRPRLICTDRDSGPDADPYGRGRDRRNCRATGRSPSPPRSSPAR